MASEREHITECRSEIAQVVLQELEQRGNCTASAPSVRDVREEQEGGGHGISA